MKKYLLTVAVTLILIAGISVTVGSAFVKAEDRDGASVQKKYYKSIQLEAGDTLWAIANEYRGDHYDSIYDYIDEVIEMNGLKSDEIHAGQYLTIPYYDSL